MIVKNQHYFLQLLFWLGWKLHDGCTCAFLSQYHQFSFAGRLSSPFSACPKVRTKATAIASAGDMVYYNLDYRGANEFIEAHYPQLGNASYFDGSIKKEPIWNARHGIVPENECEDRLQPSLHQNGFTLVQHETRVDNFTNFSQIQNIYLSELTSLLHKEFDISKDTHHILFWNPVVRGEALKSQDRIFDNATESLTAAALSTTAGMVHIDTDVGAHETPNSFLQIMFKNRVLPTNRNHDFREGSYHSPSFQELEDEIQGGKRFFILNFWRNGNAQNPVIRRSPLGVFLPRYDSPEGAFPKFRSNPQMSRWYYYPNMTYDECLVFKQYDRDAHHVSDIWHSALRQPTDVDTSLDQLPPRMSFDIRALVVSKTETVPFQQDRYTEDRVMPVMDYEESGKFCNEQDKRQIQRETAGETN